MGAFRTTLVQTHDLIHIAVIDQRYGPPDNKATRLSVHMTIGLRGNGDNDSCNSLGSAQLRTTSGDELDQKMQVDEIDIRRGRLTKTLERLIS